jgi:hypothetical protein
MSDFNKVDSLINDFIKDKQFVSINKDAKTDWCRFEYRGIGWTSNGLNHLIEISPKLKSDCTYDKWNLTSISIYDENRKRFFCKHSQLIEVSFQELEEKLNTKLDDAFNALSALQRKDLIEFMELKSLS